MSSTDVTTHKRLETIGEQDSHLIKIGEAALLLAKLDLPDNSVTEYLTELDLISTEISKVSLATDTLSTKIATLSEVIFKQQGYHGDVESYNDPHNANLMRVIDRRKGLPVALGILLIHAARSQGWDITGVNFPGHFLLRLSQADEHALISPFDNAQQLNQDDLQLLVTRIMGPQATLQPEFIQPVSDRDILIRLQNNIKVRALKANNPSRAIVVLESMSLVAPTSIAVLAELALLETSEGYYQSALKRLDKFLERYSESEGAIHISNLREKLKRHLN